MRIATAFTEKAKKEVHQSELKSFGVHFPCEIYHVGYADLHTKTWGLIGDTEGWREDYLIFKYDTIIKRKKVGRPQKIKSEMEEKEHTNNRVIIDIYPISRAFNGGLVSRPAPRTYEVAANIAASRSRDFEKDKRRLIAEGKINADDATYKDYAKVVIQHWRGTNLITTEIWENGKRKVVTQNKPVGAPQGKEEVIDPKTRVKKYQKVLNNTSKKYTR
jgi:hypothetical protein